MSILRKLYDWVLHWAKTPYGAVALFVLAFAESSFFPIPPDALLIALVLGARNKAFKFALNCTAASVLGALLGYALGHYLWWNSSNEFSTVAMFFFNNIPGFTEKIFYDVKTLYDEWNFWIIFTAGFTPIPYKVFTISGGAFDINIVLFVLASIVSRAGRFFLVAFLIWKFGDQIKGFIDKYFNWLAIAFTILLVGGFVVIKYIF
ncbi:MAG: cytochrome B [Ignavibacteriae bacterium HGW-Ignavibacteriae-2]|jgi:membrane protein YqaA with SNARE-associated domain|nr:MAG: cytochrome B [Ignavibacteriae bacterium HGW-Ignavibacteriae-2]